MKKRKKIIGRIFYFEWLILVIDYFKSIGLKEKIFDVVVPFGAGCIVSIICMIYGKIDFATKQLADVLISLISILIGFSVMLVTLLLTSGGRGIEELKQKKTDKIIHNEKVSLFQKLHIQFTFSLICEILLLIIILSYYFFITITNIGYWQMFFLIIFISMTLNILLSIFRGIVNVYFVYYGTK